jgi:hypothetical protein
VSCLGRDTGLTRQQVWRHKTTAGIADPATIARVQAATRLNQTGWLHFNADADICHDDGLSDEPPNPNDEANRAQEDEDEDEDFWKGDPFYEQAKPHLEQLFEDSPSDNASIHALTLDLLRWKRSNRVTDAATNELFGLLSQEGSSDFPTNLSDAWDKFNGFRGVLKTYNYEMCGNGCHRFPEGSAAGKTCPVCAKPARDAHGNSTTCTFTKFPLKDKLRMLFANPQGVALVKSHSSAGTPDNMRGEGNQRRTYSIYGTYDRLLVICRN